MSGVNMVPDHGIQPEETDEEREDYLDHCAAAEAIDEALETGEVTSLEDFVKELGLEKDCDLYGPHRFSGQT
jgi:hypothetical protein